MATASSIELTIASVPGRTDARVSGAEPGAVVGVALGRTAGRTNLPQDVTIEIADPQVLGVALADANGTAAFTAQFPIDVQRGETFVAQAWAWPAGHAPGTAPARVSALRPLRVPAFDATADVYVLFGQSNAEGHASSAGLPPELRGPLPRCRIWNELHQTFEPMQDGVNTRTLSPPTWCGPELSLGAELTSGGAIVHLIKIAVANTTLGPSPGPFDEWNPEAGELYAVLQQRLSAACARLRADRLVPRFAGVCLMQGESDAITAPLASAYREGLTTLLTQLRVDLATLAAADAANVVPIALGRIHRGLPPKFFPFVPAVRNAQTAVAAALPRCAVVETSELTLGPDGVHLDTAGVMALGRAFAASLQRGSKLARDFEMRRDADLGEQA